jgi:hypothetical protein
VFGGAALAGFGRDYELSVDQEGLSRFHDVLQQPVRLLSVCVRLGELVPLLREKLSPALRLRHDLIRGPGEPDVLVVDKDVVADLGVLVEALRDGRLGVEHESARDVEELHVVLGPVRRLHDDVDGRAHDVLRHNLSVDVLALRVIVFGVRGGLQVQEANIDVYVTYFSNMGMILTFSIFERQTLTKHHVTGNNIINVHFFVQDRYTLHKCFVTRKCIIICVHTLSIFKDHHKYVDICVSHDIM